MYQLYKYFSYAEIYLIELKFYKNTIDLLLRCKEENQLLNVRYLILIIYILSFYAAAAFEITLLLLLIFLSNIFLSSIKIISSLTYLQHSNYIRFSFSHFQVSTAFETRSPSVEAKPSEALEESSDRWTHSMATTKSKDRSS